MVLVQNVSMKFNLSKDKVLELKEHVIKTLKRQLFFEEFWALRNVSFIVDRGEVLRGFCNNG